jgi:anti-sigma B factor antagonist
MTARVFRWPGTRPANPECTPDGIILDKGEGDINNQTVRRVFATYDPHPNWILGGSTEMSSQPRQRRLTIEDIGDVTVVHFSDRKIVDAQLIQNIGDELNSLVEGDGRRKVLLNFGNVEYLSSTALGILISLNKKLKAFGGRLILCDIDPRIYEVFKITKLDRLLTIQQEEQVALQAF